MKKPEKCRIGHVRRVMAVAPLIAALAVCAWSDAGKRFEAVGAAIAQEAEPAVSPTMVQGRPREAYYPNTEDLSPDEMRVIACGTGMPTTRASQAVTARFSTRRIACRRRIRLSTASRWRTST